MVTEVVCAATIPVFAAICVYVLKLEVKRSETKIQEFDKKVNSAERSLMEKVDWRNCEARRGEYLQGVKEVHQSLESFKEETLRELGVLNRTVGIIASKVGVKGKGWEK